MNPINAIGAVCAIALIAITGIYTGKNNNLASASVGEGVIRLTVVDTQTHSEGNDLGDHRTYANYVLGSDGLIIGTAYSICTIVARGSNFGSHGLTLCSGVYNLPKGKLTFQGTRRTKTKYTFVVTGGSGIYVNAGGVLNGFQISDNPYSQRVIIHLGR